MEIDESGWHDLNGRLDTLDLADDQRRVLIDHLQHRLVSHFGVESFECHIGKNDPRRHATREVAAAALAHLAVIFTALPEGALAKLIDSGAIGAPMLPPWDDHWRDQERTASWRS